MVLTNAQVTAFFTGANSMAIPAATVAKLSEEGIKTPTDLRDFDKDTISGPPTLKSLVQPYSCKRRVGRLSLTRYGVILDFKLLSKAMPKCIVSARFGSQPI
jgi:hypothetical protein